MDDWKKKLTYLLKGLHCRNIEDFLERREPYEYHDLGLTIYSLARHYKDSIDAFNFHPQDKGDFPFTFN